MTGPEGKRSARDKVGEGIRQGIGVLSAFKEALEETIQEARERGDLSTDRAKEVMKQALDRAQAAAEDARERFDFVPQGEFESLRAELAALRARLDAVEAELRRQGGGSGPAEPGAGTEGPDATRA